MFLTSHKTRPAETRSWGRGAEKWSDSARYCKWVVNTDSQGYHTVTELHKEGRWLFSSWESLTFLISINKIIMKDNSTDNFRHSSSDSFKNSVELLGPGDYIFL